MLYTQDNLVLSHPSELYECVDKNVLHWSHLAIAVWYNVKADL